MQNLSNEVQSMKTELIKANKLNQERTDKRRICSLQKGFWIYKERRILYNSL